MRRLIPLLLVSCASGPSLEEDRRFIKETTERGAKAADENDFDRGVRLYEESLVAARRHPELAPQARSIESCIEEIRQRKADVEQGHRDWADLVVRYKEGGYSASLDSLTELLDRIKAVQRAHEPLGFPWTEAAPEQGPEKSIEGMRSAVNLQYQEALALSSARGLLAKKREIELTHLREGREDFGSAVEAWRLYLDVTKDAQGALMALLQMHDANRRALEAWKWLWKRCDKLGTPETLTQLEANASRFRGTGAERKLREKIEQLKR